MAPTTIHSRALMREAQAARVAQERADPSAVAVRAPAAAPEPEPEVSFAERLVDAISELIDAKLEYAEARRSQAAEYASSKQVHSAAVRIEELLHDVRVVGKLG